LSLPWQINDRFMGRRSRYAYTLVFARNGLPNSFAKVDLSDCEWKGSSGMAWPRLLWACRVFSLVVVIITPKVAMTTSNADAVVSFQQVDAFVTLTALTVNATGSRVNSRVREVPFGAGCSGAELVFVPRKGARAEDDGYLAGFVFDENTMTSELRWLILSILIDTVVSHHNGLCQPVPLPTYNTLLFWRQLSWFSSFVHGRSWWQGVRRADAELQAGGEGPTPPPGALRLPRHLCHRGPTGGTAAASTLIVWQDFEFFVSG
jgi:hypothetical protein